MNLGKVKIADILETCAIRKDADCLCSGCEYKGEECVDAHRQAYSLIRSLQTAENNEKKKARDEARLNSEGKETSE